jgi:DNA-binding transcriptional MerR regulator
MELMTIGAVSHITGIHVSSLRRWERLGLIKPKRLLVGSSSQRIYTRKEVGLLQRVKEHLDDGYGLRRAFELAREVDEEAA